MVEAKDSITTSQCTPAHTHAYAHVPTSALIPSLDVIMSAKCPLPSRNGSVCERAEHDATDTRSSQCPLHGMRRALRSIAARLPIVFPSAYRVR